jgi:hypothetical protein
LPLPYSLTTYRPASIVWSFANPKTGDSRVASTGPRITLMKRALLLSLLIAAPVFAQHTVHVRPSVTKQGVYRPPHVRTSPDHTQRNNWSSSGNVNPYTGKAGHKRVTK